MLWIFVFLSHVILCTPPAHLPTDILQVKNNDTWTYPKTTAHLKPSSSLPSLVDWLSKWISFTPTRCGRTLNSPLLCSRPSKGAGQWLTGRHRRRWEGQGGKRETRETDLGWDRPGALSSFKEGCSIHTPGCCCCCCSAIFCWLSIHSFSLSSVRVSLCSKIATVCQGEKGEGQEEQRKERRREGVGNNTASQKCMNAPISAANRCGVIPDWGQSQRLWRVECTLLTLARVRKEWVNTASSLFAMEKTWESRWLLVVYWG